MANPKYIAKPYEQMTYPGQRVQVDVKIVPSVCIIGDAKAENEYSRYRYIETFEEHNTYTSAIFLEHVIKFFPFKVECVQTDNGCESTKKFVTNKKNNLNMFEKKLKELGIKYKRMRSFNWLLPKQYLFNFQKLCLTSL